MKKSKKFTLLCVFLCLIALLASSCADGNKFVVGELGYKDKKTDVEYIDAPACYEAIARGDELYGQTKNVKFYAIEGQDPLKWICEESGIVFYADGEKLPKLSDMTVSYIEICEQTSTVKSKAKIDMAGDISAIIGGYSGMQNIYYSGIVPEFTYKIRFADESRGIYYCLTYIRYSEDYKVSEDGLSEKNYGKDFLYNRFEDRFTPAPAELVKYINELRA